jgi:hypothetical protein
MDLLEKIKNEGAEERILATLAYFEIFELALSFEELQRLMPGKMLEKNELENLLKSRTQLVEENGYFVLRGKEKLLSVRKQKNLLKEELLRKINKWKWVFEWVPFVEFVAVCNYLSFNSVEKNSDIDLLVVAKPGRIFLAKVFLTIYMHLLGVRRHGDKVEGRFCLSFYVNENSLNFKPILLKDDVYFAYWLVALLPLYGSEKIWRKIAEENKWISGFVDSFEERREKYSEVRAGKSWWKNLNEWILKGLLGDFIEKNLVKYFISRNAKRSLPENASVIVSEAMLKFHNHDKRAEFRDKWLNKLKKLSIKQL